MSRPPDALIGPALPRWGIVAAMVLVAVVAALNFLRDLDELRCRPGTKTTT